MTHKARWAAVIPFVALLVGCATAGASPVPTNSPAPTVGASPSTPPSAQPSPSEPAVTHVGSPAQAAAVVFASEGISGIGPSQPEAIGQSAWYEASADAHGYSVIVTAGAGDCPAGCIKQHTWSYHVAVDGTVMLVSEDGDDVPLPSGTGTADQLTVNVTLAAGPTCPVERNPPDPNCAPRPVANTGFDVYDSSGTLVASGVSDADGTATAHLPGGAYYVVAAPAEGLMGQAQPLAFAGVGGDTVALTFMYDTGIR